MPTEQAAAALRDRLVLVYYSSPFLLLSAILCLAVFFALDAYGWATKYKVAATVSAFVFHCVVVYLQAVGNNRDLDILHEKTVRYMQAGAERRMGATMEALKGHISQWLHTVFHLIKAVFVGVIEIGKLLVEAVLKFFQDIVYSILMLIWNLIGAPVMSVYRFFEMMIGFVVEEGPKAVDAAKGGAAAVGDALLDAPKKTVDTIFLSATWLSQHIGWGLALAMFATFLFTSEDDMGNARRSIRKAVGLD